MFTVGYFGAKYYYTGSVFAIPAVKPATAVKVDAAGKADAAAAGQLNFQTPATTIMEKIVDLHHDIIVVVFVS
jgi:hypothetical protein